jgi:hypothetical protein
VRGEGSVMQLLRWTRVLVVDPPSPAVRRGEDLHMGRGRGGEEDGDERIYQLGAWDAASTTIS